VVLLLAAAFSLLAGGALLFTHQFPAQVPPVAPDPHARPLDFADRELRHALDEYARFGGRDLPHIADFCGGPREVYRSVHLPGLGDGSFEAVDIEVSGSTALVKTWAFTAAPTPDGRDWQVVSRRVVDADAVAAIRSDAERLLLSDLPAAIGDAYTDASELVVETCRHERYHFYRRRLIDPHADDPLRRLSRSLLALAR